MDIIRNERGVTLLATIILLFFITSFLFSILMWHDSLYRNFDALEIYYEQQAIEQMNRPANQPAPLVEETIPPDESEPSADQAEIETPMPREEPTEVEQNNRGEQ